MKKLKVIFVVAMVAAIGVMSFSFLTTEKENFYLTNVEALTGGEAPSFSVNCFCKERIVRQNVCSVLGSSGYCGGGLCAHYDSNCR